MQGVASHLPIEDPRPVTVLAGCTREGMMMDSNTTDDARALELAYLACASRGAMTFTDLDMAVAEEYLRARYILSARSLAGRLRDSKMIVGTCKGMAFEETSKRFVMTFRADGADEDETVRSDRTDGRFGTRIRAEWNTGLVGRRVRIYKINEGKGSDPRHSSGFRVAPIIRPIS